MTAKQEWDWPPERRRRSPTKNIRPERRAKRTSEPVRPRLGVVIYGSGWLFFQSVSLMH
jgi:hypothetical protein